MVAMFTSMNLNVNISTTVSSQCSCTVLTVGWHPWPFFRRRSPSRRATRSRLAMFCMHLCHDSEHESSFVVAVICSSVGLYDAALSLNTEFIIMLDRVPYRHL